MVGHGLLNIWCPQLLNLATVPFVQCWSFVAMSLAKSGRLCSRFAVRALEETRVVSALEEGGGRPVGQSCGG